MSSRRPTGSNAMLFPSGRLDVHAQLPASTLMTCSCPRVSSTCVPALVELEGRDAQKNRAPELRRRQRFDRSHAAPFRYDASTRPRDARLLQSATATTRAQAPSPPEELQAATHTPRPVRHVSGEGCTGTRSAGCPCAGSGRASAFPRRTDAGRGFPVSHSPGGNRTRPL